MADVQIVDFSRKEADLLSEILAGTFGIIEMSGGTREAKDLFGDLIDALDNGDTIQITA